MSLTQLQWDLVAPIVLKARPIKLVSGRTRQDDREIMNGILWVCRTGTSWKELPSKYPSYQTCHRHFQEWVKAGVWGRVLIKLATDLKRRGKMDLGECYIDGSFAAAKKGAL